MPVLADNRLAEIGRKLVEQLGGQWTGRGGLCRCPAHDDRSPSLSIRLGDYGLFYHCFAGCDIGDVLREIRRLDRHALMTTQAPAGVAPASDPRLLSRVRALWDEARPILDTPAERYLLSRRLDPAIDSLRFHFRVPFGSGRNLQFRPAMLAPVWEGGGLVALHRTFLSLDGRLARDIDPARRMLGRPGRGAVRLRPARGRLGLGEGIETALSAMHYLDLPVWAALGAERLASVEIPLGVRCLIILADNDVAGRRAAARAAEVHAAPGRSILRWWPGRGANDWNDRLRAEGKGVGDQVRYAA
ncbi:toprim domain-containing protein [Sphingomonas sp. CGMCC 1.13654]|uniref:Toprim domain-containing protein n=2 Tax=Sphingomonas chungangi TaxID=2683589 RepID=A0A838L7F3_9SPHN|nr:toprim domain-containing protein [Sphingomonas chungangi]MBA2934635.1 toprim domain-containing protein [Sphingomonas chungangi]MVW57670.1 virulence-associated protein E [Sphingomonas chungangi]